MILLPVSAAKRENGSEKAAEVRIYAIITQFISVALASKSADIEGIVRFRALAVNVVINDEIIMVNKIIA